MRRNKDQAQTNDRVFHQHSPKLEPVPECDSEPVSCVFNGRMRFLSAKSGSTIVFSASHDITAASLMGRFNSTQRNNNHCGKHGLLRKSTSWLYSGLVQCFRINPSQAPRMRSYMLSWFNRWKMQDLFEQTFLNKEVALEGRQGPPSCYYPFLVRPFCVV